MGRGFGKYAGKLLFGTNMLHKCLDIFFGKKLKLFYYYIVRGGKGKPISNRIIHNFIDNFILLHCELFVIHKWKL